MIWVTLAIGLLLGFIAGYLTAVRMIPKVLASLNNKQISALANRVQAERSRS